MNGSKNKVQSLNFKRAVTVHFIPGSTSSAACVDRLGDCLMMIIACS